MKQTVYGFRYEEIAAVLRRQIASGELAAGRQLPPETALAAEHGVNRLTLRKSLAQLEKEGLIVRQHGRGTFVRTPAGTGGRQASILYIGDYESHLHRDFYLALAAAGQRENRSVLAYNPERAAQPAEIGRRLAEASADATALVCRASDWPRIAPFLPAGATAPIFVDLDFQEGDAVGYHAALDHSRTTYLATSHLIELGHRRIAYLGAHPDRDAVGPFRPPVPSSPFAQGYRWALAAAGGLAERSFGYYDFGPEAQRQIAGFVDHLGDWPTAFVCEGDFRAVDLIHVLRERRRRVPEEVSVIGMGNTPWCAAIWPQLTTVDMGERELAALVVQLVRLPPPERKLVYRVNPRVVVHGSTAPPAR